MGSVFQATRHRPDSLLGASGGAADGKLGLADDPQAAQLAEQILPQMAQEDNRLGSEKIGAAQGQEEGPLGESPALTRQDDEGVGLLDQPRVRVNRSGSRRSRSM